MKIILGFSLIVLLVSGCGKFEYSPYQTKNIGLPENLNASNINALLSRQSANNDTLRFIFTGDSQRFYDDLNDLVKKANTLSNVDFLVLAGDITDFGLAQEFVWITKELAQLNIPYMAVVGNHDLTSNGSLIYNKVFGPKNFSFTYKKHKFIFHDTNGREYNFNGNIPDLDWMSEQLNDPNANWFIGVSHVPPFDVDFDKKLESKYNDLWASKPNFLVSLHGHLHAYGDAYIYDDKVRYITTTAVKHKQFMLFESVNGVLTQKIINY